MTEHELDFADYLPSATWTSGTVSVTPPETVSCPGYSKKQQKKMLKRQRKADKKQAKKAALAYANTLLASYGSRHITLHCQCPSCHAEIHAFWHGEPPYTLVCGACQKSYSIQLGTDSPPWHATQEQSS